MSSSVRDKSGELMQMDNPIRYASIYNAPLENYFGARFSRNWNTNRPQNVVHSQAERGPYLDSYEEYVSDIKLLCQNLSIIPEYSISQAFDYVITDGSSLYNSKLNSIGLLGVVPDQEEVADSSTDISEQLINSDYIDLNSYLNEELDDYKISKIKIKIKAAKKLLPYNGFYPQIRLIQLANAFSSSYQDSVILSGSDATFKTVLTPFYSPGIAFNSIKSGVGMPFSIVSLRKSANAVSLFDENIFSISTSSYETSSVIYDKIPWKSILNPGIALSSIVDYIVDVDPDIRITSSFFLDQLPTPQNKHDKMANNFYSEIINFYKEDGKLTNIKSNPVSQWQFPDLKKKYSLSILINKRYGTTHSSFEGYGPRPYIYHCPPWHYVDESIATGSSFNSDESLAPSASYQESISGIRIIFDPELMIPTGSNTDYLSKGVFTIGDILRYSNIEYFSPTNNLSSSVNVEDIVDIFASSIDKECWQPTLNWECPTADLNFSSLDAKLTNSVGYDSGDDVIGNAIRGIWHQYSYISRIDGNSGLWLTANDAVLDSSLTGSLLDIVGFERTESKKIGKISDSKELSETLIIMPFYMDSCGVEKYFDIDIDHFEKMYKEDYGIIKDLKKTSEEYIFPPALDFIRQRTLSNTRLEKEEYGIIKSPILMFPFKFSTIFNKTDLSNIWQGVLPDIGAKAEIEYQEHEFDIREYLKEFNYKLPNNTRFKIFRIKKRAIVNYQQILDKTAGKESFSYEYGYNWPYDFCSLVEMAEVKVELDFEAPEE